MTTDNLVYVYGTTKDEPVMHEIAEAPANKIKDYWVSTECGEQLSFSFGTTILPKKHAARFCSPCGACFGL